MGATHEYRFAIRTPDGAGVAWTDSYQDAKEEAVRMAWSYRTRVRVWPSLTRAALIAAWDQDPPDAVPYCGGVDRETAAAICAPLGKGYSEEVAR